MNHDKTLCGKCLLHVYEDGHHHCDMMSQIKGRLNDVLIAIQSDCDNKNDSKQDAIHALGNKIANLIERMVVIEDAVERLQKGEQTDTQGYTWVFNPEDLIQRVAAFEMQRGLKVATSILAGTEIRQEQGKSQKHLEKCLHERNERIRQLEEMNYKLEDNIKQLHIMMEGKYFKVRNLR